MDASALVMFVDTMLGAVGSYPVSIYGSFAPFLLTVALPVAFVAYFLSAVMPGRTGELSLSPVFTDVTPLVGVPWFAGAYALWRRGLRRYQSSGH